MRITQADFRTVRIIADGLTVLLRYSLFQNGDERLPESIVCRGDQVTAYFLTSTIRDFIVPEERGLSLQRSWSVLQAGRVGLSFCLEFPELTGASWLLPGVARGESVPLQAEPADGALTALPDAVYLLAGKTSVLVFADPTPGGLERGSVELTRRVEEEEPLVRVEVRCPPRIAAKADRQLRGETRRASRPAARLEYALEVNGSFERASRLNLVIAPAEELFGQGVAAALARLAASPPSVPAPALLQARTREEIASCREKLLVSEGGTCGLRLAPGAESLSASAGAGLAALLLKLFPKEEATEELALRLADFALRAQLPTGFFYERYDLRRSSWLEAEGKKPRAPAVLAGECADTAHALLALVGLLRRRGLPHARYLHAAARAVSALAAAAGTEQDALVVPEPLVELFLLTGKDAHKKTLAGIRDRYFTDAREPEAADSVQPALRRARAAAALIAGGFAVKGLETCFLSLLPWIQLNPGEGAVNRCGGLLEELGANRLSFRGFELAHVLARLAARQTAGIPLLRSLLPHLLSFTLQQPAGVSYYSLTEPGDEGFGPVDSRILVRELTARHRLLEEFPQYFRRSAAKT